MEEPSKDAQELASQMTDYVNAYSRDKNKDLARALTYEHRTLQQSTLRMMLEVIEMMAEDDYRVDGRNEDSKKIAQKLMKSFAKEIASEQNVSVDEVIKNWEVYKPSKWLPFI